MSEFPIYCFIFVLWMTIVYVNLYIALSKNQNFILWFVISLLSGPVATYGLMFIIQERIDFEKTGNIYKKFKCIKKKTRFKVFNWNDYCSTIEELDKNFNEKDLLKLKYFLKAEIETRKTTLTLASILGPIIITFAVGLSVYIFTSLDSSIDNASITLNEAINEYSTTYKTLSFVFIVIHIIVLIIIYTLASKIKLFNALIYVHELKEK